MNPAGMAELDEKELEDLLEDTLGEFSDEVAAHSGLDMRGERSPCTRARPSCAVAGLLEQGSNVCRRLYDLVRACTCCRVLWRRHLLVCWVAGAADTGGSAVEAAEAAAKRKEVSKEAVRAEVCGKFTGTPGF
jgi:hypothetical protein